MSKNPKRIMKVFKQNFPEEFAKAWGKGTGDALILDWPGFLKWLKTYRK